MGGLDWRLDWPWLATCCNLLPLARLTSSVDDFRMVYSHDGCEASLVVHVDHVRSFDVDLLAISGSLHAPLAYCIGLGVLDHFVGSCLHACRCPS